MSEMRPIKEVIDRIMKDLKKFHGYEKFEEKQEEKKTKQHKYFGKGEYEKK
jgi:hypothetical protein